MLLAVSASAQDVVQRDGVWAQTYVGRAADPAVTFGQLPNGMRYAIQHNTTPPGQMAVRLLIGSGSLAEPDESEGIAHFVEHMAFRGSTHVADGELARILQRQGLAFGPDTNASTTQEATVYQFDFPKSDAASVESALMLMRETASELIFPQAAVDAERGVVLSEERERDSPAYRMQKMLLGYTLAGQLAPRRWPIGSTEVIAHATPAQLRAFYIANYRPDNATLVIVGDVDPAAVEVQIKARFGDWKPAGLKAVFDTGRVAARGEEVRLFSVFGAPRIVEVYWLRPLDRTADTDARERRDLIRLLATTIINRRFAELAQKPSPPFIGAGFSRRNVLKSADQTTLVMVTAPDKWQSGLTALIASERRIVRDGVTQAELDQADAQLTAIFNAAAANESTRPSPKIANSIVREANDNGLLTSPAQDLAEVAADLKTITIAEVNAAVREAFTGAGPLLFGSSPTLFDGGAAALRSVFDAANTAPVEMTKAAAAAAWPYTSFGAAGSVVDRHEIADLGTTVVRFANGNTLTVKPTQFAKDEVLVDVEFGHGRVGLPKDLERAYWMVSGVVPTFLQGGTGKLPLTDITNLLAARVVQLNLETRDTAFVLAGRTRPQDLDTQLQLATAYLTDPGFRPEAALRMQTGLTVALPQIAANPVGVLQRDEAPFLHGGDTRWTSLPSAADLTASRPDDLRPLLVAALTDGPVDVVVVGDVTVEQAIVSVAATFGALRRRPAVAFRMDEPHFPATAKPVVFTHTGRGDQAIAVEAWPVPGFWGHESDDRSMKVAMQIIQTRLFDELRATDGTTYSPSAGSDFSFDFAGYGYAAIRVAAPPQKIGTIREQIRTIITDLAAHPVSRDELTRAKQPLVEQRVRDRNMNGYWLSALVHAARDPRALELIRNRVAAMQAVDVSDIQRVCRVYLSARPVEIVVQSAVSAAQ